MNNSIKKDNIQKAIINFTWDRLETIEDKQIEGAIEAEKDIDDAIEKIENILNDLGIENVSTLLNNVLDACQYKTNLLMEKAYKIGMSDGLKFITNLTE